MLNVFTEVCWEADILDADRSLQMQPTTAGRDELHAVKAFNVWVSRYFGEERGESQQDGEEHWDCVTTVSRVSYVTMTVPCYLLLTLSGSQL